MVAQNDGNAGAGTATSDAGDMLASNITKGLGVKVIGETRHMLQGAVKMTDRALDVMIQGKGFFVVTDANGNRLYTRVGSFKKNNNGELVTQTGQVVQGVQAIPGEASALTINESGEMIATVNDQEQNLGQFEIATFMNESGLEQIGNNLFKQVDDADNPVIGTAGTGGRGKILQHALEESNVETVQELVNVMQANTTFGLLMKIIEADKKLGEHVTQAA